MWNEMNMTNFVLQFLPPLAELLILSDPTKKPAVITVDLDGDDSQEIAAAFTSQGITGLVILKNCYGNWYPVNYIKGRGYGISYLNAIPVSDTGLNNLVIGWQFNSLWSELDIIEWTGREYTSILKKPVTYSKIVISDIPPEDGKNEIALWMHDTGEAYFVDVHQLAEGALEPFPEAYPHYFRKISAYYAKLVKENPSTALYWYYLADAAAKTGKYKESLSSIQSAIKLNAYYPSKQMLLNLKSIVTKNQVADNIPPLYPAGTRTSAGSNWGYIDNQGNFAIKPQYNYAMDYQDNGLSIVEKGSFFGVIDRFGKYVVEPRFKNISPFSEGRAAVVDNEGFKVIDEKGKILTPKAYNYIGTYHENRALFSHIDQGKYLYGYLDRQGKEVIPLKYEAANDFKEGKALVKLKENLFALIDPKGTILHTYNYGSVGNLGDGLLSFQRDYNSPNGYLDVDGNVVIQPRFSLALPFENGRAVVNASHDIANQYGLIDEKGNYIINPQYNEISLIGENRAAVGKAIDNERPYIGSIFAVADAVSGQILTDFIYSNVSHYKNGYASASNNRNTFFIDKNGKTVRSLPVVSGIGTLEFIGDLIRANIDLRSYYMNRNGRIIWKPNTMINLNRQYKISEGKYAPNKDYLVYYPQILGMRNFMNQKNVNTELRKLSEVKLVDPNVQLDYNYTGDFSVTFFKKNLLVLKLDGYKFYFGAAHGMPTEIYPNIDLVTGRFYQLKDLFKPDSNYVKVLSDIIGEQIKTDPQYDYIFPNSYKGITADQPFYVKEDALYIYFKPYEIAPYSAGFPTFRIPYAEIMSLINTDGPFWKSFH